MHKLRCGIHESKVCCTLMLHLHALNERKCLLQDFKLLETLACANFHVIIFIIQIEATSGTFNKQNEYD
jgi:hypothetical protein